MNRFNHYHWETEKTETGYLKEMKTERNILKNIQQKMTIERNSNNTCQPASMLLRSFAKETNLNKTVAQFSVEKFWIISY